MSLLPSNLAFIAAVLSATALYAASPHCLWLTLRRRKRHAVFTGSLLALASLAGWISVLGASAGVCAMLASWMLALIALPYLALLTGTPGADVTTAEND